MKRIIHFDLNSSLSEPSYSRLYDVLKDLNGKKITESVYWIDTQLNQEQISFKIRSVINKTDVVYFISVDKNNKLFCSKI